MAAKQLVGCWVDQSIGEENAHLALKERFNHVSNHIQAWKYFDNADEFRNFVDETPNANIIVIISGHLAKTSISLVSHQDNLHSVYLFCGNKSKYENLKAQETKIKCICIDEDELYEKIYEDLKKEFS